VRSSTVRVLGVLGVAVLLGAASLVVARPAFGTMIHADDNTDVQEEPRTRLLYPVVVNGFGYETTLALTNTSADPYGTEPKSGSCTFYFYGNGAPQPIVNDSIEPGELIAIVVTNYGVSAFQGYAIADCDFPFARGVGFVNGDDSTNLDGSYTAERIKSERHAP
jgi:hypothetical protein